MPGDFNPANERQCQRPSPNGPPIHVDAADDVNLKSFLDKQPASLSDEPVDDELSTPVTSAIPILGDLMTISVFGGGVAAAFFMLTGGFTSRTAGATVSARLKWEERQRQIDVAVAADDHVCRIGTSDHE